ncbi:MAG: copper chaperone [Paraburkholderia sp.]|nr:MAG: copper chaperone [Paraburkholderia sp.]
MHNDVAQNDIARIGNALRRVDPDANVSVDLASRSVVVESWLMPEEFLVAFADEDLNAKIINA